MQHAVDAEADDERVLLRLPVDVRGAVLGGLEDDGVDEPDERGIGDAVVGLEVVRVLFLRGERLCFLVERGTRTERLRLADEAPDLGLDVVAGRDGELDGQPRREAELVDRVDVARVGDGDTQDVAVDLVRESRRCARARAAARPSTPPG